MGRRVVWEKTSRKLNKKNLRMRQILDFCQEPKTTSEILGHLGLSDRMNLMRIYLNPMLAMGILVMTEPEKPTSRNQKYKAVK